MKGYIFFLIPFVFWTLLGWVNKPWVINRTSLRRHRRRVFASRFADPTELQRASASLTTPELIWAYYLPDHRASSKSVIRDQLLSRGVAPAELENWLPPAADLTVPAYAKHIGETAYFRLARLRWVAAKGLLPVLLAIIACKVVTTTTLAAYSPNLGTLHFQLVYARVGLIFSWATLILTTLLSISLFLLPYVSERFNRRVLILRPFGDPKMTRPLKRLVMNSIGRFGHVFTLSDRNYRPSAWVYIAQFVPQIEAFGAMLLGMILRNSVRLGSVANERTYRSFQNSILNGDRLSLASFVGDNQAFNIRCSNEWWQLCVLSLMHSSDVILIDLSNVKSGTEWEIQQLASRRLLSRSIFIAHNSTEPRRSIGLAQCLENSVQIHRYDSGGRFLNESAFIAELRTRFVGSHLNENYLTYHPTAPCFGWVLVRQNITSDKPAPSNSVSAVASGAHGGITPETLVAGGRGC